nr:MAG TPA: Glycerophosphoryl diester phosphodiesterase [Caudoviricetes sp.]
MRRPGVFVRRRDGGDVAARVFLRRREGGDVEVFPRREAPAPAPAPTGSVVDRFLASKPFYVAHRLGGTEYPEFTRQGLEASLRAGFKALELSVRRCSTGEFVLIHDWVTTRTVPGTDYQIWNTPWSVLAGLQQASGGFLRLTDVVDQVGDDIVLAIDHKVTSSKPTGSQGDMESEIALFDYLDTIPNAKDRVLIKQFVNGGVSERAKAKGYKSMCMMYPAEVASADLAKWDVLGMEWNAEQGVWDTLKATGKPLIAHVITTQQQADTALARGATGLMASVPSVVHP